MLVTKINLDKTHDDDKQIFDVKIVFVLGLNRSQNQCGSLQEEWSCFWFVYPVLRHENDFV